MEEQLFELKNRINFNKILVSDDVLLYNIRQLNAIQTTFLKNPCRCLHRQYACGSCMSCDQLTTIKCENVGCPEFVCQYIKTCNKCGKNHKTF